MGLLSRAAPKAGLLTKGHWIQPTTTRWEITKPQEGASRPLFTYVEDDWKLIKRGRATNGTAQRAVSRIESFTGFNFGRNCIRRAISPIRVPASFGPRPISGKSWAAGLTALSCRAVMIGPFALRSFGPGSILLGGYRAGGDRRYLSRRPRRLRWLKTRAGGLLAIPLRIRPRLRISFVGGGISLLWMTNAG